MPIWGCSQRNVLSCAFQETAVYGEHIWFETNVSGDFCYVGEQNCMAKLLVSHLGSPTSPARAAGTGCAATPPGDHDGRAAAAGGHTRVWGAAKVGTVSLLSLNAGGLRPQFLPALVLSLRWKPHTELPLAWRWYDDIPGRGCWAPSPLEGQSESKTFQ